MMRHITADLLQKDLISHGLFSFLRNTNVSHFHQVLISRINTFFKSKYWDYQLGLLTKINITRNKVPFSLITKTQYYKTIICTKVQGTNACKTFENNVMAC